MKTHLDSIGAPPKALLVGVAVVMTTLAAAFLLTTWLDALLITFIYSTIARELGEFTRLNPFAVKVITGALTLAGAATLFHFSPKSGPFGAGVRLRRIVFVGVLLTTLLNAIRWGATSRDNFDPKGETLRWYVLRADGSVDYYYEPGVDRRTGRALQPVTIEMFPSLEAFRKGDLRSADPESTPWFSRNGQPNLWYWRDRKQDFEFWSGPGFHPFEMEELKPVDREVRQAWLEQKENARETLEKSRAPIANPVHKQLSTPEPSQTSFPPTASPPTPSAPQTTPSPTSVPASKSAPIGASNEFLNFARFTNRTTDTLEVQIHFPDGWKNYRLPPQTYRLVGIPRQQTIHLRWRGDGAFDEKHVSGAIIRAPYSAPVPELANRYAKRFDFVPGRGVQVNLVDR